MKCSIKLHFIWVYTVCKGEKDVKTNKNTIFCENYNLSPLIYPMDYPKFIVSNQKEESISIQRVKAILCFRIKVVPHTNDFMTMP